MSSHLDPMCYPILFPRGDLGWHTGIAHVAGRQTSTRNRVTMQQYYAYRLAIREGFSPIHNSGKLFQQYVVDAYVKTEGCRLYYIRNNQAQLRVDLYSGLMDHLHSVHDATHQPGIPVVLPSSFSGSPRAMQQNFQDAMAIVARYGRPDLFLTYTCNPKIQEITENLQPGERPEYRPDLVSRVFKLHLTELLGDIKNRHILGVPVALIYVIEFQKRGLPHCHMLIILRAEDKLRDRNDIDRIISAEIPDREVDEELYDLVKSCMIHGPCGVQNPSCVCMENGSCTKNFPKDFCDETQENINGYPVYRRRNNGRVVQFRNSIADNRYVVPYNSFLLRKYRAHINLEACASIRSVKYLFKYVYKGHDCANVELVEDENIDDNSDSNDEIKTYLNCRYVSAPEAIWRLSEYKLHEQSHTVYRLAIHLPSQQRVYFREGEEMEAVERESAQNTHLTAWFKLNAEDPTAHRFLYSEVPQHYVFNKREKKWTKRQRGGDKIISRMYSVSPADPERFFLRMLLLHVPGACSYDDLKTVSGEVAATFREACIRLHLLADDTEYDEALTEASHFQMPKQLRSMFATICTYCQVSDPMQLWIVHSEALIEDFVRTQPHDVALNVALHDIDQLLQENGSSCATLGLPLPQGDFNIESTHQLQPTPSFSDLNNEQTRLTEAVLESIYNSERHEPEARCFYVDAPGGSGKTYVFNKVAAYLRYNHRKVSCAAWTGIAATLLAEGRTVHNLFKLPVPIMETSTCNVPPNSKHADMLRHQTLFIIDEASMIPSHALHAIDRCLQDITGITVAFGSKVVLLGGDFRQVLPVVPRVPPSVVIDTCLKRSPLWPLFQQHSLTQNMRARPGEQEFARWLIELGNGTLKADNECDLSDTIEIPPLCLVSNDSLINEVFSGVNSCNMSSQVILSPKNENCLELNEKVLQMLPGQTISYLSADSVKTDNEEERNNYPLEFLNSLTPSGMPPHQLNLKVDCIIMLLRNLSLRQGLCNGTRLRVTHLHQNSIQAQILEGHNSGNNVLIPRVTLAPSDANLPFTLERNQFPIRLAYSMTINKAQGQTFEKIGIFLPNPVFAHGQLYVAFSRARAMRDVKVEVHDGSNQGKRGDKTVTLNIVYNQIL